ncbi:IS1595 family transposase [Marinicellulosiphila megalodicopiae]|uniref:IS1595 family transposase n=1 Tax=Marinicellulosiphila megalodicopiae TaxID=2724896 RepID=UPI003BAFF4EA
MQHIEYQTLIDSLEKLTIPQCDLIKKRLSSHPFTPNPVLKNLEIELDQHPHCPKCHSSQIIRFGQAHGRQRYRCKGCTRTFMCTNGTQFFRLHNHAKWLTYIENMVQGKSLRECAKLTDMALSTSFNWRHRFLSMAQTDQPEKLEGIIEAHETYFKFSQKGERNIKRQPRKRGEKTLSKKLNNKEWTPVLVAVDRAHHEMDFILNAVTDDNIDQVLAPRLASQCILCTDNQPVFNKLCEQHQILHKVSHNLQTVEGVFHIKNVNEYNCRLQKWMERFHGVATKYLGHYLGWFRALETQKYEKTNTFKLLALQQHCFET